MAGVAPEHEILTPLERGKAAGTGGCLLCFIAGRLFLAGMKIYAPLRYLLVAALLLSVSCLWAQKPDRRAKKQTVNQEEAAKQSESSEASGEDAKAKEGKVVGTPIARAGGKWLGLTIENGGFRLNFYDEKKKPTNVDAARATARWNPSQRAGQMTVVMLPATGGQALSSGRFVPPPRIFKVYLTLLNEQGEALESYVVDFRE